MDTDNGENLHEQSQVPRCLEVISLHSSRQELMTDQLFIFSDNQFHGNVSVGCGMVVAKILRARFGHVRPRSHRPSI
jgi:hypothetical protein